MPNYATVTQGIDPNDPRLTERLIPSEPDYENPIARAMYEAGYAKRASRIEHCGEHKTQRCEDGHITRIHRFCDARSCTGNGCAPRRANNLVESFMLTVDHAIKGSRKGYLAPKLTFVDFRFHCEPSHIAISALVSQVINHIKNLEGLSATDLKNQPAAIAKGRRKYPLTLWAYAAGIDDSGLLVLRVLILDANISPEILREQFGAVSADVHVAKMYSLPHFLPLLFAVAIPSSIPLRVQMELSFIGVRRLRTINHIENPDEEELFVEEGDGKDLTNNFALEDEVPEVDTSGKATRTSHPKMKLCPICHKHIVAESNWTPQHRAPQPATNPVPIPSYHPS